MELNTRVSMLLRPGASFGRMESPPLDPIRHCILDPWIPKIRRSLIAYPSSTLVQNISSPKRPDRLRVLPILVVNRYWRLFLRA